MEDPANPRNTCRIVEGRLLEIDVAGGYNRVAEVTEMMAMIARAFGAAPARTQIVIAADWRPCKLFTPDVSERAVEMLTAVNPRIERSAILHRDDQATSVLQVMRALRESGMTMLVVSHELQFARAAADRVVFMDHGAILDQGAPEQIFANPEHARVREFVATITQQY